MRVKSMKTVIAKRVLGSLVAVTLTVALVASLGAGKAQAFHWLNPNPDPAIVGFAYNYLANCDTNGTRSPAFSQWLSPAGRSDVAQDTFVFTKPASGTAVPLRFNIGGAVCFTNSAVYQTTIQYINNNPSVQGLPPGSFLNFTGFYGPGNFNIPGTYRWAGPDFNYILPSNLGPGTYNFNVPVSMKRINQFSTGKFICVSNGGSIFVANALDFGPCPILTLDINITVVVPAPVLNSPVANCQSVSGSVSNADNVTVQALLDGVTIGTKNLSATNNSFNFATPASFRDGRAHTARIILRRTSDNVQLYVGDYNQSACPSNAQCIASDFSALNGGVDEGGTYNVTIKMQNTGDSYWKNYSPSNRYKLALTTGSANFTADATTLDIQPPAPPGPAIAPGQPATFNVKVVAKLTTGSAGSVLGFRMSRFDGTTDNLFGTECGSGVTIPVRAIYGPWLRTQNGDVAAFGKIIDQPEGKRGGRNVSGSGNSINKDATYFVMSALSTGANRFCSTNAYLLGRTTDNVNNCDFDTYEFSLKSTIGELITGTGMADDGLYDRVNEERISSTCTGASRYSNGGTIAKLNSGNLSVSCPTISQMNGGPGVSLGGGSPVNISQGRGTVLVDGDLIIDRNITTTKNNYTYDQGDFTELNKIPNLGVIVRGNIIITNAVTEIEASLYASGRIITCDTYANKISTGTKSATDPIGLAQAKSCSNPLTVKGLMSAKGGFTLGRNYVQFAGPGGINSRLASNNFTDPNFDAKAPGTQYYGRPAEDVIFNGLLLFLPPPGFEDIQQIKDNKVQYLPDVYPPQF